MARIRSIKPEFWTDAKVVRLSPLARLMFVGAWNFADDFGCLPADAFQLKLRVLPTEDTDADELVAELFDAGLLEALKTSDAREFWHVTNWSKHQRVSKPSPSDWGLPTDWKPLSTSTFTESPGTLPTHSESPPSGKERKGEEGKGMEGNGVAPKAARDPIWDSLVELFGAPMDNQRGLYNRVRNALAERNATPDQIRQRTETLAAEWTTKGETRRFGVWALEKWWPSFDGLVGQASGTDVEKHKRDLELQLAQEEWERTQRKAIGQ